MAKQQPTAGRDPEVQPSRIRSTWTATQKLALLAEYAAFPRGAAARCLRAPQRPVYLA
jgi:hypothetical protein